MIAPGLLGPLFGLAAALSWGAGDFNGGLASRKSNVYIVMLLAEIIGMPALVALLLISHEPFPVIAQLGWAVAAGATGILGLGMFYLAMSRGQMAIAAPVTGVLAILLPVIFTALFEGLPPVHRVLGFVLAMLGIYMLSRPHTGGETHDGLGLAVLSGLFFGGYFILMARAGDVGTYWPLITARISAMIVTLGFIIVLRPTSNGIIAVMLPTAICGLLDASGNIFYLGATQNGRLDAAAVLSSLYPVVTTLLAIFFLKEKLARMHWIGLLASGAAIALVTI